MIRAALSLVCAALLLAACSEEVPLTGGAAKPTPPSAPVTAAPPTPEGPAAGAIVQTPLAEPGQPGASGAAPAAAPPPAAAGTTVAVLLPLSGPSAAVGTALLNAAELALFEVGGPDLTLLPFDTKGTPDGAAAAAQQALAKHPDVFLGPVFSAEVKAAGAVARQAGISLISFSADRNAAGHGVYILGFLPGPQALRVVAYARSQNKPRVAILAPDTEYGRTVVNEVENNGNQLGITVANLQYYDPNSTDFSGPVRRLAPGGGTGDLAFDALLLPDEGSRLHSVAASLPLLGVDPAKAKLLGTQLWGDADPGTEPALVGGWYAAPPTADHIAFAERYAKAYGNAPPPLASLGYDAAALVGVLARQNAHDFSASTLTNPVGFTGVDGLFRLLADGTTERGYAVMEVVPGGPAREIDPAPKAFNAPAE